MSASCQKFSARRGAQLFSVQLLLLLLLYGCFFPRFSFDSYSPLAHMFTALRCACRILCLCLMLVCCSTLLYVFFSRFHFACKWHIFCIFFSPCFVHNFLWICHHLFGIWYNGVIGRCCYATSRVVFVCVWQISMSEHVNIDALQSQLRMRGVHTETVVAIYSFLTGGNSLTQRARFVSVILQRTNCESSIGIYIYR